MYKVVFEKSKIKKTLKKLSPGEQKRIIKEVEQKLSGYYPLMKGIRKVVNTETIFRLRIGGYRVLFSKDTRARIITVVLIEKRDSVYKDKS